MLLIMEKPDETSENNLFLVSTPLHISAPAQRGGSWNFQVPSNANHSRILWYCYHNLILVAKSESQMLLDDLTAAQALLEAA